MKFTHIASILLSLAVALPTIASSRNDSADDQCLLECDDAEDECMATPGAIPATCVFEYILCNSSCMPTSQCLLDCGGDKYDCMATGIVLEAACISQLLACQSACDR